MKFNKILIIQSLGEAERKTGYEVETRIKHTAAKLNWEGQFVDLIDISTRREFFAALEEIKALIKQGVLLPLVHIEMHGSPEGLALSGNGEFLRWVELREPFREINILSKNNLFVSLATCFGGHFLNLYVGEHGKPCPFFGYVGATRTVSPVEVETSFSDFFQTLMERQSFFEAMVTLHNTINDKTTFAYVDCNLFYDMVIEEQDRAFDDPNFTIDWVNELKISAKQQNPDLDEKIIAQLVETQINREAVIGEYEKFRGIFLHKHLR
jgi:hypothetical protein